MALLLCEGMGEACGIVEAVKSWSGCSGCRGAGEGRLPYFICRGGYSRLCRVVSSFDKRVS